MTKRVYIYASVVGEQFENEFCESTVPIFDAVTTGQIAIIVSDLSEAELLRAPKL